MQKENSMNEAKNRISLIEKNQQQLLMKLNEMQQLIEKKFNKQEIQLNIMEELLRLLVANQFLIDLFKDKAPFKLLTNKDIRDLAEKKQIKLPARAKKSEMIHIIQKAEGNLPCYANKLCNNLNCLWYSNCQKEYKDNYI